MIAPDLTPKLQLALNSWREERAQLLQSANGDSQIEADQLRSDMERQEQQLAEALVRLVTHEPHALATAHVIHTAMPTACCHTDGACGCQPGAPR